MTQWLTRIGGESTGTINEQPRDGHSELFCCVLLSASFLLLHYIYNFTAKYSIVIKESRDLTVKQLSSRFEAPSTFSVLTCLLTNSEENTTHQPSCFPDLSSPEEPLSLLPSALSRPHLS